jgi:hypothetical protein
MRSLANLLGAAFLIVVTLGIFFWIHSMAAGAFNFDERQKVDWTMPILSAALMLAGVVFGALYAELQHDDVQPIAAMKRAFQKPGLYRAFLVAPIVFAGVYAFARSNTDTIIVAIFAFQNGFFCESIFRKTTAAGTPAKP